MIEDHGYSVPICSQYPLTDQQVFLLEEQFGYACYLYQKFIKAKGYKIPEKSDIKLSVYLTTYKHINDLEYFPRSDPDKTIIGRYVNGDGNIFIIKRAFWDKSTLFYHECAHWINDIIGIKGPDNEKLAQEFEKYITKRVYGK